ncbi:topology modulation protein [Sphingomonas sp.]|uniref:topology modulation protein n=1 Tax=Sphingomonas sp. TaxID=28214 RepID=UPI001D7C6A69|nr:topology modulation protein [Sphingomonas sp.]MBX9797186.1 topology modulation protein [Sphingomonas sp.]
MLPAPPASRPPAPPDFQRVIVIGSSGAGKSTFARRLGAATGLPVTHIDQLFWQAGWVQRDKADYLARLQAVVAQDRWIIEGVNPSSLDLRLPRADLLIWLECHRLRCLWRVGRRVAKSYGRVRPDMAPGCPEQLPDLEFLRYIWTFGTAIAPRIEAAIDRHDMRARTVRLRGDRAAARWLAGVGDPGLP